LSSATAATAAPTESAAGSRSSAPTSPPKVNRTEVCATSGATPQAMSTCEGSSAPAAHADPEEVITPRCSSSSSTASPEVPGKQNEAWFGSRPGSPDPVPDEDAPVPAPAGAAPVPGARGSDAGSPAAGRIPRHGPAQAAQ